MFATRPLVSLWNTKLLLNVAAECCHPQAISISGADSGTSTANKAEARH